MKKDLIKDKPYQIIEKFNERKITPITRPIHSFYDRNGRACKIVLANDDKIIKLKKKTLKN